MASSTTSARRSWCVMIGTNNIDLNTPDEIAAGITAICAELHRRAPAAHILLLGIFPRGKTPDATRARVDAVNQRIASLDGTNGVTYLDIGKTFLEADGSISTRSCTTTFTRRRRAMPDGPRRCRRRLTG